MMADEQLSVPVIDISPLFSEDAAGRDAVDRQLGDAGERIGAMVLTGLPAAASLSLERAAQLSSFFDLPLHERRAVALSRFAFAFVLILAVSLPVAESAAGESRRERSDERDDDRAQASVHFEPPRRRVC